MRSGGTLFSLLMDGHPQVLAHPGELPFLSVWNEKYFNRVKNDLDRYSSQGYPVSGNSQDSFRILRFIAGEMWRKSGSYWTEEPSSKFLDFYFDNVFTYWVNHPDILESGPIKKLITGFRSGISGDQRIEEFLFRLPRIIYLHIIRDPYTWWRSFHKHTPNCEIELGIKRWVNSQKKAIAAKNSFPERTIIIDFKTLTSNPEKVARYLCKHFGLTYHPVLLKPSLNGKEITNNSSFSRNDAPGTIIKGVAEYSNREFSEEEIRLIQEMTRNPRIQIQELLSV